MAGRSKKDATEGLTNLKQYLRRDHSGLNMLKAIEKYLGELRQTQTTLKAEVERLGGQLANVAGVKDQVTSVAAKAVADLQREKYRTTQLAFEPVATQREKPEAASRVGRI